MKKNGTQNHDKESHILAQKNNSKLKRKSPQNVHGLKTRNS